MPAPGKPALLRSQTECLKYAIDRSIIKDDVSHGSNPMPVPMTKHAIRHWCLELERASKDYDATQHALLDTEQCLKSLQVCEILSKRILKTVLSTEVKSCPGRIRGIPKDPARAILQLYDEDSVLGDHQVVNLCRAEY